MVNIKLRKLKLFLFEPLIILTEKKIGIKTNFKDWLKNYENIGLKKPVKICEK